MNIFTKLYQTIWNHVQVVVISVFNSTLPTKALFTFCMQEMYFKGKDGVYRLPFLNLTSNVWCWTSYGWRLRVRPDRAGADYSTLVCVGVFFSFFLLFPIRRVGRFIEYWRVMALQKHRGQTDSSVWAGRRSALRHLVAVCFCMLSVVT